MSCVRAPEAEEPVSQASESESSTAPGSSASRLPSASASESEASGVRATEAAAPGRSQARGVAAASRCGCGSRCELRCSSRSRDVTAPWPRSEMCLRYAERTRLRRQSRPASWVGSKSSLSHATVSFLCSTKEHVRPPPNRASRFQSRELGKGRFGAMSSKGAKRIGMHPPG